MGARRARRRPAPQRGPWVVGIALQPSGAVVARAGTIHTLCGAIGIEASADLIATMRTFDTRAPAADAARQINRAVAHLCFPPADEPGPEGGA